jgi:hypothetical protein
VTNIDRLEKAIQKSLDSQRALTLQTQSLLAEMQRRGVLKRLGGYIWQLCQQFRDSLLRDDNGDVVCDDAGDALEG